jgi:hypothetical protein
MTTDDKKATWQSRLKFAVQLVGVLLVSAFLLMSNQQRSAIAQVLRDPLSVLADRSPGERGSAALRQTKIKRTAILPAAFEKLLDKDQTVSPVAFTPAGDEIFPERGELPALADAFVPGIHDGAHDGLPGDVPPSLARGGGFFPIIPGGGFIGGGGGGGGGGGDDCGPIIKCGTPTGEPTPTPILVSVPEPGTWLMIIAGFFALGGLLRFAELSRTSVLVRSTAGDPVAPPRAD